MCGTNRREIFGIIEESCESIIEKAYQEKFVILLCGTMPGSLLHHFLLLNKS